MCSRKWTILFWITVQVSFLIILGTVLHSDRPNISYTQPKLRARNGHLKSKVKLRLDIDVVKQKVRSVNSISSFEASVAIGLAITSRGCVASESNGDAENLPFFQSLLKSFCRTASFPYDYRFYIAYDQNDSYFGKEENVQRFRRRFRSYVSGCPKRSAYSMQIIRCSHRGKPAWAQNDAMIAAYLNGVDYFYRVNDDTVMITKKWTERFISVLNAFKPPRLGVVGPWQHGGNRLILTYEFTHRTHIDVHGFYYPRAFTDWYADRWMSRVYPRECSVKLRHVRVLHTGERGTRYSVMTKEEHEIEEQIVKDTTTVSR